MPELDDDEGLALGIRLAREAALRDQATAGKAYLAKQAARRRRSGRLPRPIWRVGTPSIDPALRQPLTADDDRADDFVVALAQWNGALLVTGDSRLLKLVPPPSIVTPRGFLDMCEARF